MSDLTSLARRSSLPGLGVLSRRLLLPNLAALERQLDEEPAETRALPKLSLFASMSF